MKKVVKFSKDACPHCKIFDPIFKETMKNYKDDIEFYEVNIEQAPHLREVFNIRGVPALYTFESEDFKDFEKIEQLVIGHSHEKYSSLEQSLKDIL